MNSKIILFILKINVKLFTFVMSHTHTSILDLLMLQ